MNENDHILPFHNLLDHSDWLFVLVCPIGTYKSTVSNDHHCEQCPLNSHTNDKGAAFCLCDDGFFRLNSSIVDSSCIGKG